MAGKPANSGRGGNKNGSLRSAVASFHRAIDRNSEAGVSGSVVILDGDGFGTEAIGLQRLLQQIPRSRRAEGTNSDRNDEIQGR